MTHENLGNYKNYGVNFVKKVGFYPLHRKTAAVPKPTCLLDTEIIRVPPNIDVYLNNNKTNEKNELLVKLEQRIESLESEFFQFQRHNRKRYLVIEGSEVLFW